MFDGSVLALDLGATSGRGIVGQFDGQKLTTKEVDRFPTGVLYRGRHLCTDFSQLLSNIRRTIAKADSGLPKGIASVGVDSWGLDVGLLGEKGELLSDPVHYRDAMGAPVAKKVFQEYLPKWFFMETGAQPTPLKSLFTILALRESEPGLYEKCRCILNISDLVNYFLTGERCADRTIIGTSLLYSAQNRQWSQVLMETFQLPSVLFPVEMDAGCILNRMRRRYYSGQGAAPYVALACGHDTASAFLASGVRAGSCEAVISCGTRALIGTLQSGVHLSEAVFSSGFTNETGFGGDIRLLKSCVGMSLFEQFRQHMKFQGGDGSYRCLQALAGEAKPFARFINPEHIFSVGSEDICSRINDDLAASGQPKAETPGEFLRCILESCACCWAWAVLELQTLMPAPLKVIHAIGGGSQNSFLMQLLADLTGIPVQIGPTEASALGNILTQLYALGELNSISEIHQLAQSIKPVHIVPPSCIQVASEVLQQYRSLFPVPPTPDIQHGDV